MGDPGKCNLANYHGLSCLECHFKCAEDATPTPDTTTTTTTIARCPFKKIYGEDSEETELLRYIRDNILSKTQEGRELIRLYYEWGPVIAKAIEEEEGFKEEVKGMIDEILLLIEKEAK
jgi:hypothetical protein